MASFTVVVPRREPLRPNGTLLPPSASRRPDGREEQPRACCAEQPEALRSSAVPVAAQTRAEPSEAEAHTCAEGPAPNWCAKVRPVRRAELQRPASPDLGSLDDRHPSVGAPQSAVLDRRRPDPGAARRRSVALSARPSALARRLKVVDRRLSTVDPRRSTVDVRFLAVDSRLSTLDSRLRCRLAVSRSRGSHQARPAPCGARQMRSPPASTETRRRSGRRAGRGRTNAAGRSSIPTGGSTRRPDGRRTRADTSSRNRSPWPTIPMPEPTIGPESKTIGYRQSPSARNDASATPMRRTRSTSSPIADTVPSIRDSRAAIRARPSGTRRSRTAACPPTIRRDRTCCHRVANPAGDTAQTRPPCAHHAAIRSRDRNRRIGRS